MVLIIPHVNSEFSALIFDWKVTLSSQIIYLALLHLLHLKKRELQLWNDLIFTNLIHHDTAFVPAHLGSGAIPFFPFPTGAAETHEIKSLPTSWIPESCWSFSQTCVLLHILFDPLLPAWAMFSAPGKRVCDSDGSFWQLSPISSFRVLFQKGGCV